MKKIGILSLFYKNGNYGACLQAYALTKYLQNETKDIQVEQINFDGSVNDGMSGNKLKRILSMSISEIVLKTKEKIFEKQHSKNTECKDFDPKMQSKRYWAFADFKERMVKGSEKVYTYEDIKEVNAVYDAFVVGSDQVWRNECVWPHQSIYLLDFVENSKLKVAYAASISKESLSRYEKRLFKKNLTSFDAVSVREKRGKEILDECTDVQTQWVLDPTFLLDRDHWESLTKKPNIDSPYIFCYFLGTNAQQRATAKKYADKHGLKIVTLPFLLGVPNEVDDGFGDEKLWSVSPEDFLSLINNAEAVFSDSFHAMVFSFTFQKSFYIFSRDDGVSDSRIKDFLSITGLSERFCQNAGDIESIDSLPNIDYNNISKGYYELLNSSKRFVKEKIIDRLQ